MSFVANFRKQDALLLMPVFLQESRTVNKTHYAAISMIGAIPAAALVIFLLLAVTSAPLDNMTINVKILTFFTMALGAFVAVGLPFWIMFFGGPKAEKTDEVADKSSSSQDDADDLSSAGSDEAEDILEPEEEEIAEESEEEMVSAENADIYEADE